MKKRKLQPQLPTDIRSSQKAFDKYLVEAARKLPFFEIRLNENWQKFGFAQVFISRIRKDGSIIVGIFLVDVFCLGLKNTMYRLEENKEEYDKLIEHFNSRNDGAPMIHVDKDYAHNIIWGGIEYAEDLGFDPHKDFEISQFILDPADEIEFIEIEFGKDGKPFYMSGPKDNVPLIQKKLQAAGFLGDIPVVSQMKSSGMFEMSLDAEDDDENEAGYSDFEVLSGTHPEK